MKALSKETRALTATILVTTFSLLAAERFLGIDRDYYQYLSFYDELHSFKDYNGRFEIGFVALATITKFLTNSFWFFLLLVAFTSLSIKFFLLSKQKHYWLWFIIYLLMLFPLHEMTQLRVALAIGFGYLALYATSTGRPRIISAGLLLLGSSFQASILILLPFVFFWERMTRPNLFILFIIALTPSIILNSMMPNLNLINPLVESMLESRSETSANILSTRNAMVAAALTIGFTHIKSIPPQALPWLYLTAMGASLWIGMINFPVFAHRLLEITLFSMFFWVPFLPFKSRILASSILLTFACYSFFRMLYIEPLFI